MIARTVFLVLSLVTCRAHGAEVRADSPPCRWERVYGESVVVCSEEGFKTLVDGIITLDDRAQQLAVRADTLQSRVTTLDLDLDACRNRYRSPWPVLLTLAGGALIGAAAYSDWPAIGRGAGVGVGLVLVGASVAFSW